MTEKAKLFYQVEVVATWDCPHCKALNYCSVTARQYDYLTCSKCGKECQAANDASEMRLEA